MARAPKQAASPLDPAVLDTLSRLDFVARTVVEGFRSGHHRSPHRGSSVEFAQHREYVPGDELRNIDWRIFARSERLVVKEFVEETNFSSHLLVDASESMGFSSLPWSKFDYARWCAAALAHLILTQRDSAGLLLFAEQAGKRVAPGNGALQKAGILDVLEQAEPQGATAVGDVLSWLGTRLSRRGIAMVFSDFFDDLDRVVDGLRRLVHAGHEVILFQVLDPQELDFDFTGFLRLDGMEGGGRVKVDPKAIRNAYREEVTRHNEELARQARALSLDFLQVRTDQPLDAVLSTYLARRIARSRGGKS
jgi:uncharacterized protein (DUF58 family)